MSDKFSSFSLFRHGLRHNKNWPAHWRNPDPKKKYKVLIIGGGGHGLATAYYLGKNHGLTDVAVLERSVIGLGNSGRNTTIIRSSYTQEESLALYDLSVQLFQDISYNVNYNVMFSPRGCLNLAHSHHDLQSIQRRLRLAQHHDVPIRLLTPAEIGKMVPCMDLYGRFPVHGGIFQENAGVARHDAIVWSTARQANAMGMDVIQNCGVTGFLIENNRIKGVETTRGRIYADRVGVVTASHSIGLANMAGFRLPMQAYPLQALVSEPIKPILNTVIMSGLVHVYLSQSDKGELVIGAGTDSYVSYGQRGSFDMIDEIAAPLTSLFPFVSRLRMLRQWAGIVDVTVDRSPIISATPIEGLYFNCGWGTGGFKAILGSGYVFAHCLAKPDLHPFAEPFSLNRFYSGRLVEEGAAAGVAH